MKNIRLQRHANIELAACGFTLRIKNYIAQYLFHDTKIYLFHDTKISVHQWRVGRISEA